MCWNAGASRWPSSINCKTISPTCTHDAGILLRTATPVSRYGSGVKLHSVATRWTTCSSSSNCYRVFEAYVSEADAV
jgi:hypothetical protein